jgi:transposase
MASIRRKLPEDLEERMIKLFARHRWNYDQIAQSTGYVTTTVRDIQTQFFREGESALINRRKHRERRQYMKCEQEKAFLERFAQSALAGELVSVADIQQAYEQQIGRKGLHQHDLWTVVSTWMAQGCTPPQASQGGCTRNVSVLKKLPKLLKKLGRKARRSGYPLRPCWYTQCLIHFLV